MPPDVVVGKGAPGRQPDEPDHGRTYSNHGAETSRSRATVAGTVFGQQLPVGLVDVSDRRTDKPKQVVLKKYPFKIYGSKKRSFSSSWYLNRDWFEYLVEKDTAFCYAL